jgi:cytochrome c
MDSFELNKIIGAVLGTLIVVMGTGFVGDAIFSSHKPEKPGYDLPGLSAEASTGAAKEEQKEEPIAVRLASADATKGENVAKKCAACHKFNEGGPNAVGPNLYGVVDRPKAHHEGFNYSAAMKGVANEKWDYEHLDAFIHNPKKNLPGTAMSFAGIPDAKDRANLIAYLRTLSENPVPLPAKQ